MLKSVTNITYLHEVDVHLPEHGYVYDIRSRASNLSADIQLKGW